MFVLPDSIQFNPNLSSTFKSFLRALAHHCGDKSVCWPSQARIAEFMNCSTRTVQRCEKEAVELQFLRVERRWLRSNKYYLLCLEGRHASTMPTQGRRIEQTTSFEKQRLNGPKQRLWKSPTDIKLLLEDMEEVFGHDLSERNRGWFYQIAKTIEDSWIYEALSWIKQAIVESELAGTSIRSPSALFTWKLRVDGAIV